MKNGAWNRNLASSLKAAKGSFDDLSPRYSNSFHFYGLEEREKKKTLGADDMTRRKVARKGGKLDGKTLTRTGIYREEEEVKGERKKGEVVVFLYILVYCSG